MRLKKAADDAPYALQVKLQEMELAAPATPSDSQ